jgi:hypothetical protein
MHIEVYVMTSAYSFIHIQVYVTTFIMLKYLYMAFKLNNQTLPFLCIYLDETIEPE